MHATVSSSSSSSSSSSAFSSSLPPGQLWQTKAFLEQIKYPNKTQFEDSGFCEHVINLFTTPNPSQEQFVLRRRLIDNVVAQRTTRELNQLFATCRQEGGRAYFSPNEISYLDDIGYIDHCSLSKHDILTWKIHLYEGENQGYFHYDDYFYDNDAQKWQLMSKPKLSEDQKAVSKPAE